MVQNNKTPMCNTRQDRHVTEIYRSWNIKCLNKLISKDKKKKKKSSHALNNIENEYGSF